MLAEKRQCRVFVGPSRLARKSRAVLPFPPLSRSFPIPFSSWACPGTPHHARQTKQAAGSAGRSRTKSYELYPVVFAGSSVNPVPTKKLTPGQVDRTFPPPLDHPQFDPLPSRERKFFEVLSRIGVKAS